jgi:hypothetical protein
MQKQMDKLTSSDQKGVPTKTICAQTCYLTSQRYKFLIQAQKRQHINLLNKHYRQNKSLKFKGPIYFVKVYN